MDAKEKKAKLWEEYTNKANNFSDWFTAIIISNFAYLIGPATDKKGTESFLNISWGISFFCSIIAFIVIFFHKILGVYAAKMRVIEENKGWKDSEKKNKRQHHLESMRHKFFFIFLILGLFSLLSTGFILLGSISFEVYIVSCVIVGIVADCSR